MSQPQILDTRFRSALARLAQSDRILTYEKPADPHLEIAAISQETRRPPGASVSVGQGRGHSGHRQSAELEGKLRGGLWPGFPGHSRPGAARPWRPASAAARHRRPGAGSRAANRIRCHQIVSGTVSCAGRRRPLRHRRNRRGEGSGHGNLQRLLSPPATAGARPGRD